MNLHEKLCEQCKKPFLTRRVSQRYCSYACYIATTNLTRGAQLAAVDKQIGRYKGAMFLNRARKGLLGSRGDKHG